VIRVRHVDIAAANPTKVRKWIYDPQLMKAA
jgi:hypothetical protein